MKILGRFLYSFLVLGIYIYSFILINTVFFSFFLKDIARIPGLFFSKFLLLFSQNLLGNGRGGDIKEILKVKGERKAAIPDKNKNLRDQRS